MPRKKCRSPRSVMANSE
uniref:Uncharacterized protein n=1 Tax=Arundo donax TaxID=35708 RepID=A0A0A9B0K7_ARUDO